MLETKELDINTPEGWKELGRKSHTNILIDRGIEPTEENLAKFQEEVSQKVKEFEAKYPHKPTPPYHYVGTRKFETKEEAKEYKRYRNQLEKKAKELSKIVGYTSATEFFLSMEIAEKLHALEILKEHGSYVWILGTIFQAGKIEGIRKERNRRKNSYKFRCKDLSFKKAEAK